jgi:signal transduction histidine kinase
MEQIVSDQGQVINIILIAISILGLMSIGIVLFFYFSRKKIVKSELEKANLEIAYQKEIIQSTIITQERERKRIAQDLHDAISSKLNIVALNASLLENPDIEKDEVNKAGTSILKVTTAVLENSRQIAHDLLPPTLDKFGLVAALEELCEEVAETKKFKVDFCFDYVEVDAFTADKELYIFRIIQELMNNSIKHSKATILDLCLVGKDGIITLKYSDNGIGFNLEKGQNSKGLGMSGIENRTRILNGELMIDTAPNQGVKVKITI